MVKFMENIILASGSFLKNFIMDKTKLPYIVYPADIDESIYDNLPVDERVVELARKKCEVAVRENSENSVVVAADTLTAHQDGTVFTKPTHGTDPLDAAMQLSGQTIDVYTGCCVYKDGEYKSHLSVAKIKYQTFSRERLKLLAEDDNPQIRSGALGVFIDAPGFTLIEKVEGEYTGMYGLPTGFLYEQLDSAPELPVHTS